MLETAAWLLAIVGPLFLARLFWVRAHRSRHGWVFHLLFAPVVMIGDYALTTLVFFVLPGRSGPPELGAMMVPMLALLLTLPGYYAALLIERLKRRRRPRG